MHSPNPPFSPVQWFGSEVLQLALARAAAGLDAFQHLAEQVDRARDDNRVARSARGCRCGHRGRVAPSVPPRTRPRCAGGTSASRSAMLLARAWCGTTRWTSCAWRQITSSKRARAETRRRTPAMMTGFRPLAAMSCRRFCSSTAAPSGLCEASRMSGRPPSVVRCQRPGQFTCCRPRTMSASVGGTRPRTGLGQARPESALHPKATPAPRASPWRRSSAGNRPRDWSRDSGQYPRRRPRAPRAPGAGSAATSRGRPLRLGRQRPMTTGRPGLMMPAFSRAICAMVPPSSAM
jgi:hypothetical protein